MAMVKYKSSISPLMTKIWQFGSWQNGELSLYIPIDVLLLQPANIHISHKQLMSFSFLSPMGRRYLLFLLVAFWGASIDGRVRGTAFIDVLICSIFGVQQKALGTADAKARCAKPASTNCARLNFCVSRTKQYVTVSFFVQFFRHSEIFHLAFVASALSILGPRD